MILADTYAGWKDSFPAPGPEQRLARCVAESTLLPDVFVALWVPNEFFTDASPELVREMSAAVWEFHPGFGVHASWPASRRRSACRGRLVISIGLVSPPDGALPVTLEVQ